MRTRAWMAQALLVATTLIAGSAQAVMITVDPAKQTVPVGSSVDVAINISGLGVVNAPSVSTFDIDVVWDAGILGLQNANVTYGDQLDLFGLGSIQDSLVANGYANLFELSFDFPWDLDLYQAESFTLATLTFDALTVGTSGVDLTVNALGDGWGEPIPVGVVSGSVSAIPEPSAAVVFCVGWLVVAGALRRRFPIE